MLKTINFCGDSYCGNDYDKSSWLLQLAGLLKCKIIGAGKNGSSYEHAIKTFNPDAGITIFCWTEPHRIYHPTVSLNLSSVEEYRHTSKIHAAAHQYYKYLHSFTLDRDRHERDLYWFDEKILKKYKGKIIHLFSFENAVYSFKHGIIVKKPLELAREGPSSIYPNHLTKENNIKLAQSLYKLLT